MGRVLNCCCSILEFTIVGATFWNWYSDMATILRLPHLDIVLDNMKDVNESESKSKRTPRRSNRIKSQLESQEQTNKRRRRYNSVMDDDEDFSEDLSQKSPKKKEPEHRHFNRMRLKKRENVSLILDQARSGE